MPSASRRRATTGGEFDRTRLTGRRRRPSLGYPTMREWAVESLWSPASDGGPLDEGGRQSNDNDRYRSRDTTRRSPPGPRAGPAVDATSGPWELDVSIFVQVRSASARNNAGSTSSPRTRPPRASQCRCRFRCRTTTSTPRGLRPIERRGAEDRAGRRRWRVQPRRCRDPLGTCLPRRRPGPTN